MTGCTKKRWTVVPRIEGRKVAERQRSPEVVVMAIITLTPGDEMPGIFTRRRNTIMAT